MRSFVKSCINPNKTIDLSDKCSNKILAQLDISIGKVNDCIEYSFEIPGDWTSRNRILDQDDKKAGESGIFFHPTLTINNYTFRGEHEYEDMFSGICAGFK